MTLSTAETGSSTMGVEEMMKSVELRNERIVGKVWIGRKAPIASRMTMSLYNENSLEKQEGTKARIVTSAPLVTETRHIYHARHEGRRQEAILARSKPFVAYRAQELTMCKGVSELPVLRTTKVEYVDDKRVEKQELWTVYISQLRPGANIETSQIVWYPETVDGKTKMVEGTLYEALFSFEPCGGHVKPDQSAADAIKAELQEEIGFTHEYRTVLSTSAPFKSDTVTDGTHYHVMSYFDFPTSIEEVREKSDLRVDRDKGEKALMQMVHYVPLEDLPGHVQDRRIVIGPLVQSLAASYTVHVNTISSMMREMGISEEEQDSYRKNHSVKYFGKVWATPSGSVDFNVKSRSEVMSHSKTESGESQAETETVDSPTEAKSEVATTGAPLAQ